MFPSVVADVMKDIISVDSSTLISEAAQKMIENRIGSIIVTKDGVPFGIVTRSDMISRVIVTHKDPLLHKIHTITTSPLISLDANTPILDSMRFLRDRDIHQVLIIDDEKLVGIVSEGDLIRAVTICSLTQFSTLLRRK